MKKFASTNLFIALLFFSLGFLTNHLLTKVNQGRVTVVNGEERFPITPDDFDQHRLLDALSRMSDEEKLDVRGASSLGMVSEREDEQFVYYEIPVIEQSGAKHDLKVEIKNKVIKITETIKEEGNGLLETSSERLFTIDSGLKGDLAQVINEKDKIVIRIPKK